MSVSTNISVQYGMDLKLNLDMVYEFILISCFQFKEIKNEKFKFSMIYFPKYFASAL